jgi:hypothetical protein
VVDSGWLIVDSGWWIVEDGGWWLVVGGWLECSEKAEGCNGAASAFCYGYWFLSFSLKTFLNFSSLGRMTK